MRAYVALRGSRSPRAVTRDASPSGGSSPYASLNVGHPNGTVTSFELTLDTFDCLYCQPRPAAACNMCDGSGTIKRVFLTCRRPGTKAKTVYAAEVFD